MSKLKLSTVPDDTPVKLTIELPANIHRDLIAYGDALAQDGGKAIEPVRLIAPMLSRFMSTDRAFARLKRSAS
jgi:hypothetical protein